MKKLLLPIFGLTALLAVIACVVPAHAQTTSAVVVANCGTPPTTYSAGQNRQVTQDTTGRTCNSSNAVPAPSTSSGCTPGGYQSAVSTNSTSVKGSAGLWCGGLAINTTGTIYYLRLYDSATAPTCSSATGFVASIPIPASAAGAGTQLTFGMFGANFSAGIAWCITGGGASTDNTNAATGVYLAYGYK